MHNDFDDPKFTDIDSQEEEWVSKSQLKRDAHALLELGKKLVQLDKGSLAKIPLPDNLLDAINSARKIRQH